MSLRGTIMIQGTTSDAGKSTLVTALCRVLHRRGIRVAPFKPQNMALNSAVTIDGGEIGRAQAVQAYACGLEPHTDMNPILLKPNSDIGAQVIVHGRAVGNMDAAVYHDYKRVARDAVFASHTRMVQQYDVIVVEGAGSPAEINLRHHDIANMGFAEGVDCPVILVADIDRGGVFAHIVGTLELLSDSERTRVKGFIINRFRGDIALLQPGLDWLEQKTGKPVLGVMPYLHGLHIEAEDHIAAPNTENRGKLRIVVPVVPRISNHTDFDALRLHPDIDLRFVGPMETPPVCDLVILPGSKSVRADLQFLRDNAWPDYLQKHIRYGGKVLGICGGFQMLGWRLHDPLGLEGEAGSSEGLGLLDIETTLYPEKQLHRVTGTLSFDKAKVVGYEIHAGISSGDGLKKPFVALEHRHDGAISDDNAIAGTYLHGLFDSDNACKAILRWAGLHDAEGVDYGALREKNVERLADAMVQYVDMEKVEAIMTNKREKTTRAVSLILGGVRSGKSRLAEKIAIDSGLPVTYIATAKAHDDEMRARIEAHRARRPIHWQCVEEPIHLPATLHEFARPGQCVIVDCLTLWLTNCLLAEAGVLEREMEALLKIVADAQAKIVFVSNETGMGIIPMGELTRRFCDEAGVLNQQLGQLCDSVILTVAGCPITLKGKL